MWQLSFRAQKAQGGSLEGATIRIFCSGFSLGETHGELFSTYYTRLIRIHVYKYWIQMTFFLGM